MVVDAGGRVVFANKTWQELRCRLTTHEELGEEGHRLEPAYDAAYQAMGSGSLSKDDVRGVQSVLAGNVPRYETTYVCTVDRERYNLSLTVMSLVIEDRLALAGRPSRYQNTLDSKKAHVRLCCFYYPHNRLQPIIKKSR